MYPESIASSLAGKLIHRRISSNVRGHCCRLSVDQGSVGCEVRTPNTLASPLAYLLQRHRHWVGEHRTNRFATVSTGLRRYCILACLISFALLIEQYNGLRQWLDVNTRLPKHMVFSRYGITSFQTKTLQTCQHAPMDRHSCTSCVSSYRVHQQETL